jgi:hypothetical protein
VSPVFQTSSEPISTCLQEALPELPDAMCAVVMALPPEWAPLSGGRAVSRSRFFAVMRLITPRRVTKTPLVVAAPMKICSLLELEQGAALASSGIKAGTTKRSANRLVRSLALVRLQFTAQNLTPVALIVTPNLHQTDCHGGSIDGPLGTAACGSGLYPPRLGHAWTPI